VADLQTYGISATRRLGSRFGIELGFSRLHVDGRNSFNYSETDVNGVSTVSVTEQVSIDTSNLDDAGLTLGAKFLLVGNGDTRKLNLAIGGGHNRSLLRNTFAYVVASTSIADFKGRPVRFHLGARYDRFRAEPVNFPVLAGNVNFNTDFNLGGSAGGFITVNNLAGRLNSKRSSVYSGVEIPLSRTGTYSFVGEIQSKTTNFPGAESPYSVALRYTPRGERSFATLGAARSGITGDTGFFGQIGYRFGG
jgi:hypothetical protein